MTYSEKLKHPKWQKKRLEILQRDKFKCKLCFDTETELHIHHSKYTKEPWDAPSKDLITYCKHCHLLITKFEFNYIERVYKIDNKDSVCMVVNDLDRNIQKTILFIYENESNIIHLKCSFAKNSKTLKILNKLNNG